MSSDRPKVLGNTAKGLLFVISAPAGTGKTTLVEMLMDEFPCVKESVSLTTRRPRPNEIQGRHYHFVSEDEFNRRVEQGEFLEHATVFGYQYGTSAVLLREQQAKGYHVILTIDTQGALQVKERVDAVFIFVKPPTIDEARRRLIDRKTESVDVVEKRIAWAEKELAQSRYYDYNIVNDDLTTAYDVLRGILIAEEHRVREEKTNQRST